MDRESPRPVVPGPHPILQMVAGGIVAAVLVMLVKCASAGQLPNVVQCKLDAVEKVLPADPGMVTPYDAIDIWTRWRACGALPDGGP